MSLKRLGVVGFLAACAGAIVGTTVLSGQQNQAPRQLFSAPLADMPGKQLVVVELNWPPRREGQAPSAAHRHPGSVYVYVTAGTARLGIQGEPVREVKAGESFFEPVGAVHTVSGSASATEPASAIAVMIVPEGAPLVSPAE